MLGRISAPKFLQVVVSICLTTSRDLRLMASIAVCAALGCLGLALTVSVSLLG